MVWRASIAEDPAGKGAIMPCWATLANQNGEARSGKVATCSSSTSTMRGAKGWSLSIWSTAKGGSRLKKTALAIPIGALLTMG